MFLREGTQVRATSFAQYREILGRQALGAFKLGGAALAVLMLGIAPSAAENTPNSGVRRVELPREILPWRRQVEGEADKLLVSARRALHAGHKLMAERQLDELVRKYARTFAAAEGRRQLAKLHNEAGVGRRGLGVPPVGQLKSNDRAAQLDPVAGWETIVKPDAQKLGAEMIREALIEAAGDRVFFRQGAVKLNKLARLTLKKQARWLKSQPRVTARIAGHADDNGSGTTNMRLSHDRAVAVRRQLIRYGVAPKRLRVFSHGNSKPIAICTIATCAAQNRRVVTEIRLPQQFSSAD